MVNKPYPNKLATRFIIVNKPDSKQLATKRNG